LYLKKGNVQKKQKELYLLLNPKEKEKLRLGEIERKRDLEEKRKRVH